MNPKEKTFKLICGPCVIESRDVLFEIAAELAELAVKLPIDIYFKASFDKANRTSVSSYRGVDMYQGLDLLTEIKQLFSLKLLTDIHLPEQAEEVSNVVDVIQIPAFLCRQTDLLEAASIAAAKKNLTVNIKKGQFLAPWDMHNVVEKCLSFGLSKDSDNLWLTERGTSFGYNTLVVDYRSLPELKKSGCPVIFDATHSVQQPGGRGSSSDGQREYVAHLARAAVAVGVDGLFLETHPVPDNAKSDGPNMVPLHRLRALVRDCLEINHLVGDSPATSLI